MHKVSLMPQTIRSLPSDTVVTNYLTGVLAIYKINSEKYSLAHSLCGY